MSENLPLRRQIAEQLLGHPLDEAGFAPCPGRDQHTTAGGGRDFRVILSGAPNGFCFHSHCSHTVAAFNAELQRRIAQAERAGGDAPRFEPLGSGVARRPEATPRPKRPPFAPQKLADYASRCPRPVSFEWLRERSPLQIPSSPASGRELSLLFLGALFEKDERVLVFTRQWSQGDFLWAGDKGTFRLGDAMGVSAVPSPLPEGGPEGVWYLCQPVSGEWCANPTPGRSNEPPRVGRRHGGCVTAWRHLVLESDEAETNLWLRAVVQLPLPIVAVYTSGGRSVHALLRVNARSKAEWDSLRDVLVPVLCPLGADPGAMTAVRLTRLPGTLRHGSRGKDGKTARWPEPRMQELLWLNPEAPSAPILEIVR